MHTVRKILVPIDFSPHSTEATTWAAELARRFDSSVTLAHVYQPVTLALPDGYVMQGARSLSDLLADLDRMLGTAREELLAIAPGVTIDTKLLQGAPFAEIVRFAREGGFDLVVMGSHGRTGLKHALLGSVSEKVTRKAPCPVLTVRLPEHTFEHPYPRSVSR